MTDTTSNPSGTGEIDAVSAFASILSVADGEQSIGEAPEEEKEEEQSESDETSQEETEGDESEESESEEEEVAEEEQTAPQSFKVKVDGDEIEVTLDELQKGYSRTQDYTRKTQALAEQRKAAEAELEQVRQERQYYAQMLQAFEQQLQAAQEPQVDWDRLYQENPTEWVRQRELYRDRQEKLAAAQAEKARLETMHQQEQQKMRQEALAKESQKLIEAIPEWKDSKRAVEERGKLVEAARKLGFSDEELNNVVDHRAVVMLRKAALYDELMSKKSTIKPAPPKTKTLTPGSATSQPGKKSEAKMAQERLAKSGHIKDAAAAFESFL